MNAFKWGLNAQNGVSAQDVPTAKRRVTLIRVKDIVAIRKSNKGYKNDLYSRV